MIYLVFGAALLWFLLWTQRTKPIVKFPQWRFGTAVAATAVFAVAAFLAIRGQISSIVFIVLGLTLTAASRMPRAQTQSQAQVPDVVLGDISVAEAYAILDLKPGCTREEVQAAYTRLMKLVHPDKGGGAGLAAKLNAARDRLLKG